MPSISSADSECTELSLTFDIETAVRNVKEERDTWRVVALQYKAAFEAQTARLRELQDICIATQAELENERTARKRLHTKSESYQYEEPGRVDGAHDPDDCPYPGSATILEPTQIKSTWQPAIPPCSNMCFRRVEQFANECDYGTALREVDHLLRGPLTTGARAEGLLLKSSIMRKAGPEWLYDSLAACSEALELCDRLAELHSYLPQIQYQRGVCYYQLRMLQHARDAFANVRGDERLHAKATEFRRSCEEELEVLQGRRLAFEERRTVTEGLLAQFCEGRAESKRRRTSSQIRLHASKAKRLSLPHRWVAKAK
ncbi:hypothetical protein BU26DRAFT_184554 [Trematosphaeria pertusa]|uniref:Uncharacterized protein n=1 Tax=Trematosphaeria pertusa TaxID=390896 RepID=A0A6A6HSF3_9PLEO|nr:uncharacterized protein BU26DRAFT_184554 [Trematosphaeria pertusa]KAF2240927.1 hypothetical protein BU26DRAFT_184554 [Trematosphaeria pertusa]